MRQGTARRDAGGSSVSPPLRVAHVSSVHQWTDNRVHYRECASLADAGYDVTLIAVESPIEAPMDRVRVIKLPRMNRALRATWGSIRAVRLGLRSRAEVLHFHDPELAWAIPLCRLLGRKVIYDAHEDLPNQIRTKAYLPAPVMPLAVLTAHVVIALTRLSSHVVSATETIAHRYPSDRVSVVHNYPPLRDEESSARPVEERGHTVVYIGTMSDSRGADVMVEAAGHPEFPSDWSFEIAGRASDPLIERISKLDGWNNTTFYGQVAPMTARDLLLGCRVGLVLFEDSQAHRDALPTKMFEYFAAGVPVVASDFPLWRTIIAEHECGLLVDQTSPAAVAAAVRRYADDSDLLRRHSENARRLAEEKLNWSAEAETLIGVYAAIAPRS